MARHEAPHRQVARGRPLSLSPGIASEPSLLPPTFLPLDDYYMSGRASISLGVTVQGVGRKASESENPPKSEVRKPTHCLGSVLAPAYGNSTPSCRAKVVVSQAIQISTTLPPAMRKK